MYRTYEELKHTHVSTCQHILIKNLYRTYEELKPQQIAIWQGELEDLYRTYEELKLGVKRDTYKRVKGICIVPMRN